MFVRFTVITSRYGHVHKVGVGMTDNIDTSVLLQSKRVVSFFHIQYSRLIFSTALTTIPLLSLLTFRMASICSWKFLLNLVSSEMSCARSCQYRQTFWQTFSDCSSSRPVGCQVHIVSHLQ